MNTIGHSKYTTVLLAKLSNPEIIDIYEQVSHDGFDQYGPESDLLTLHMVLKNTDDTYEYRQYYLEQWFTGEPVEYELVSSFTSKTMFPSLRLSEEK